MVDEEANNGHYDELTELTGMPFMVCNAHALVLTATTSLFRTARNGTTPKPCMRQLSGRSGGGRRGDPKLRGG